MKKFLAVLFSVVLLATFMAVSASAAVPSPSGDVYHKVEIKGGETVSVKDGDQYKLEATDDEKDFEGWEITGDYEIVSGTLTSKELVILPKSDLVVEAKYKDVVVEDKEENDSDKAPQTGNGALMLTVVLTAGAFVTMVATKKAVKA